jgi:hypothetical protein
MKSTALLVMVGLMCLILADCVVSAGYPTYGPPGLRVEVMPGRPGPGYVWMGGYWRWGGRDYVWASGRWARPRQGRRWEDGRWEQQGHRWVYREGRWR